MRGLICFRLPSGPVCASLAAVVHWPHHPALQLVKSREEAERAVEAAKDAAEVRVCMLF